MIERVAQMRAKLFFPLLFVVGASCGGQTQAPPPDVAHFAAAIAQSFCGSLHSCCTAANTAYDDSACTGQVTTVYAASVSAVNANVTYDGAVAQACIADLTSREALCKDSPFTDMDDFPPSCFRVFVGKLAPGSACKSAEECAIDPDPSIKTTAYCEGGTCQLSRRVVPVGGTCTKNGAESYDCANGASCFSTGVCHNIVQPGCTCLVGGGDAPCIAGCECLAGTCTKESAQGSTCKSGNDCAYGMDCYRNKCIVLGAAHFFAVTKRSCSFGPLVNGLDDGSLIEE